MDTEDGDFGNPSNLQEGKPEKTIVPPIEDAPHGIF
jgi:YLP motif-containing protein 1